VRTLKRRLQENFWRLLRSRAILWAGTILFVVFFLVSLVLVYINATIMRDRIQDDFNQQQLFLARQAASWIEGALLDVSGEVNSVAQLFRAPLPDTVRTLALAAMYERTRSRGVIEVGVIGPDGSLLYGASGDSTPPWPAGEVFEVCRGAGPGGPSLGPLRVQRRPGREPVINAVLCAPLPGEGKDSRKCLLFARLDVRRLLASITLSLHSGESGYAFVLDREGRFLQHPNPGFVGVSAFSAPDEGECEIRLDEEGERLRERLLSADEGTAAYSCGWRPGGEKGVRKLIAFTPVRSPVLARSGPWEVAIAAPSSGVASAISRVYLRHVVLEIPLVGLLFLFIFLAVLFQQQRSQALTERVGLQEEYIESILQNSVDAIIFSDPEHRVQIWNRGAEEVFGYTAAEMIGQTFHRLLPPEVDADEELRKLKEEVERVGAIRNRIAQRITKDGRRIQVSLSRSLVRDREGHVIGSTAVVRDITEQLEVDQRIYHAEKLASIGVLAAGVAHEMNNPLGVILGFTDLLLERFPEDSEEYRDLKTIEENANHAKRIVDNLLGFARRSEGRETYLDVGQSIRRVHGIVRDVLLNKRVNFDIEVPEDLPAVRGDSREFQQVILNLINNALAAMGPEGGTLKVRARRRNGEVEVEVSDTGSGIPDRIKQRIFDPFFTTKSVGEGTGLGLSLCYGIVKKFGGRIEFTSVSREDHPEAESGTTFTVTLPVASGEENSPGGEA